MAGEDMDYGDAIDPLAFEQILEMDDDPDDREFSSGIVLGFFEQAEETIIKMHTALEKHDLNDLSSLGHFLKGSSATLGLSKVQRGCEKIQHFGSHQDADGEPSTDDERTLLRKIKETLSAVETDYADAEKRLKAFYKEA